ncbi:MAG: type II 3-dehydroquinate dehydratase [Rhizobiales bacterium]|nr:type II 3-dehydroquinate dehydratase [Hyphomicrobiales bacterium]
MKPVFVLNGPNLNMLGLREPETYGKETLEDIQRLCAAAGKRLGLPVEFRQSNIEGELVSSIQEARSSACGIVINAAAYTHTSVAIHDALRASDLPVVEVHLTNVYKREPFRHKSYVSGVAVGVICGFGSHGYELAIEALSRIVTKTSKN